MKYSRLFPALFLFASLGCAAAPDGTPAEPPESSSRTVSSASSLADALRSAGLTVKEAGAVQQSFFGVPARVLVVDGNDLQVYELASAAAAEKAAADVSPDGGSIGTSMISWIAPPHFFRKEQLIVNYLGTSEKTLSVLRTLLGAQFAGR